MRPIRSFFLGILGAMGALFLEIILLLFSVPLSSDAEAIAKELGSIGSFFFLAILAEELFKYILIRRSISSESEEQKIVISSLFFGLGFSLSETALFFRSLRDGASFDLIGILGIVIVHASTAVIIGYASRKNSPSLVPSFVFGLIPALVIHSTYNLLRISDIAYREQLTILLLSVILFLDILLAIKPVFSRK